MSDPLERVLNLVAEGRLTAEEAAPILDGLDSRARESAAAPGGVKSAPGADAGTTDTNGGKPARWARIEVREHGKRVVDLRIPISLGRFALGRVPGLSKDHIADVEEAVSSGTRGPILDIEDDDGDGVRIVLE